MVNQRILGRRHKDSILPKPFGQTRKRLKPQEVQSLVADIESEKIGLEIEVAVDAIRSIAAEEEE